jgi:DHA1 family tetracycline resistance protein-like MFS transporter
LSRPHEPAAASGPVLSGGDRKAAFRFIYITAALDMLALGVIIPVLPKLILEFQKGDTGAAAATIGIFGTTYAAMQFLFSPLLGVLSDRVGRRPVVLISNLGMGLDYLFMTAAPSIAWLFVGRLISGICGASYGTAGAYVADITPPSERAKTFGRLATAFGLGFVVGPALGGLLGQGNPRMPFVISAVLSLANWLYGYFILPESLPVERRTPTLEIKRANPVAALGFLRATPEVLGLASVSFLCDIAHQVLPTTFVLYASYRFHWSTTTIGLALASVGIASASVQGALIGPFVKRFGERASLLSGLTFGVLSFALFGAATTSFAFWFALPFNCLTGLWRPPAQAMMSRRIDPSSQGRLQGALSSVQGFAFMIGPGLFSGALAMGVQSSAPVFLAGVPYFIAALLMACAFVVAARTTRAPSGQAPAAA